MSDEFLTLLIVVVYLNGLVTGYYAPITYGWLWRKVSPKVKALIAVKGR